MSEFFSGINALYVLLLVGGIVGSFFAGRRGSREQVDAATERLNKTLGEEVDGLRRRLRDIEQDRDRQDRIFTAIRYALKTYKLKIVINHEFVTIIDENGTRKTASIKSIGNVTPIKPQDDDENGDAV